MTTTNPITDEQRAILAHLSTTEYRTVAEIAQSAKLDLTRTRELLTSLWNREVPWVRASLNKHTHALGFRRVFVPGFWGC